MKRREFVGLVAAGVAAGAAAGCCSTTCCAKKGTILFRIGAAAVRDDGARLQVSDQAEDNREVCATALRLAIARYGNRITVGGTARFREQIVRAAAENRLDVRFGDEAMERLRRQLLAEQILRDKQQRPRGRGR